MNEKKIPESLFGKIITVYSNNLGLSGKLGGQSLEIDGYVFLEPLSEPLEKKLLKEHEGTLFVSSKTFVPIETIKLIKLLKENE